MNWTVENGEHVAIINTKTMKIKCVIWEDWKQQGINPEPVKDCYSCAGRVYINNTLSFFLSKHGESKEDAIAKVREDIKVILKEEMRRIIKEVEK